MVFEENFGSGASLYRSSEPLSDLWAPEDEGTNLPAQDLGQLLLDAQVIDASQLSSARKVHAKTPGKSLSEVFFDMGVDEHRLQLVVARLAAMAFETIDLEKVEAVRQIEQLGIEFCQHHRVLPLRQAGSRLLVGVTDPDNLMIIDEIRHKLGMSVKPTMVCRSDIIAYIERYKEQNSVNGEVGVDQIIGDIEADEIELVKTEEEDLDLEKMAGESPVIRFVNYLIFNAVKDGASDIHIEPQEQKLQVRYRIDGVLFDSMNPPRHLQAAIISRLKIMANLDISERRLPQDGRIRAMVHGRKLDLRLSTLPTAQGEKAVLRILDTRSIQVSLNELGMDGNTLLLWKNQIHQPHGIILVTGPTGSGKTTTLYASLGQMNRSKLNISTVEDPVEYHINGINQTQVLEKIGMSFPTALRALLRQDPDVIMVGEIRDMETARVALQASLTGHLVLSTLHTNDAPSSVTRLINLGIEPYLIGSAVNACLAQRLVRRICDQCKKQVPPDENTAKHLAMHGACMDEVWMGKGCAKCRGTGYNGRLGLYEILVLNDNLRDKISENPNVTELRRMCAESGMVTLREDGFQKVVDGTTTVKEVLRVSESTI